MADKKPLKVSKKYRKHPLSHTEGGVTVRVEQIDGQHLDYENVKFPDAFIRKAMSRSKTKKAYVLKPGL